MFIFKKENPFVYFNSCLLVIFSFAFFIFSKNLFLLLPIFIFILLLIKKWQWLFLSLIFFGILILVAWVISNPKIETRYIEGEFKIGKKIGNGFVINKDNCEYFVFNNKNFEIGDIVFVKGYVNETNEYFYFDKLLKSENLKYFILNPKVKMIQHSKNIFSIFKRFLLNKSNNYSQFITLILFGQKNENNLNLYQMIKDLNISHLFIVSGFHFQILFLFLNKIFNFIRIKNKIAQPIVLLILFFYLWSLNFSISSFRSFLFLVLMTINKNILQNKWSNFFIWQITVFILLSFNPCKIINLSFILSVSLHGLILLLNYIYIKISFIKLSFYIYVLALPLNVFINQEINVLGWIWPILFSPIISFTYILTFCFWFVFPLLEWYFWILKLFIENIQLIVFKFPFDLLKTNIVISLYLIFWLWIIIFKQWNFSMDRINMNWIKLLKKEKK